MAKQRMPKDYLRTNQRKQMDESKYTEATPEENKRKSSGKLQETYGNHKEHLRNLMKS